MTVTDAVPPTERGVDVRGDRQGRGMRGRREPRSRGWRTGAVLLRGAQA